MQIFVFWKSTEVTYNDTIFSNMNIVSDLCCIYNRIFSNENMITNMKGKESYSKKRNRNEMTPISFLKNALY